nr:hypothetical protein [Streptomonospora sp. PA3]
MQIRDVPEEVRDILADRAHRNGQSLQAYLHALVVREASCDTNIGLLDELADWTPGSGVTAEDAVAARDAARAERGTVTDTPSPQ